MNTQTIQWQARSEGPWEIVRAIVPGWGTFQARVNARKVRKLCAVIAARAASGALDPDDPFDYSAGLEVVGSRRSRRRARRQRRRQRIRRKLGRTLSKVRSVARKIATSKVMKGLGKVASKLGKFIPAPYGTALTMVGKVQRLAAKAAAGNPAARRAIAKARILAAAKRGGGPLRLSARF
jgi:hypothetical protein